MLTVKLLQIQEPPTYTDHLTRPLLPIPTPTGTLLSPLGDYAAAGWFDAPPLYAGQGPAALSPAPTATAALTWLGTQLALTALMLLAARLLRSWRSWRS